VAEGSEVDGGHDSPERKEAITVQIRKICCLTVCLSALLVAGCWDSSPDLNSLPPTLVGTLEVQPKGRQTKELYDALIRLGDNYGLVAHGSGTRNGVNWRIMWFCKKNATATAITSESGDLVLFQAYVYGFKQEADYERFKFQMLRFMKQYGKVTRQEEGKRLSNAELAARERHMKMDLTTQCEKSLR
jgi:hypothetical protein